MVTPQEALRDIVKRVGGEMYLGGRAALVPSPGHGPKDRGLSLRIKGDPPRLLWWSHNGAQAADVWRHLGLEPGEARQETEAERRRRLAEERAERERKRLFCAGLWSETLQAERSPVETYLVARGISGPIPRAIRFHAAAPLRYPDPEKGTGWLHPVMVAVATGPDGRSAVGLHVTALRPDGSAKAEFGDFSPKRMFGEFSGAVAQLGALPDDGRLAVAEGIETALAYRDLTGLPTWAALSTSGLRSFSPPEGVRHLTIAADGDVAGREADQFAFSLDVVSLGHDEDGDEITTCVIQPEDVPERQKAGRKSTVAQKNAETLKTAFNRIFEDKACVIHAAGANGVKGLRLADLRAEALVIGLGPAEPGYDGMDEKQKHVARKAWLDHRNKTFNRAVDELRTAGGYRIEHDWIWEITRGSEGVR